MFSLKIIRPKIIEKKDSEDITISEAIETIYSKVGQVVIISWNGINIPVFGSSIGSLIYNIVSMIKLIKLNRNEFTENFLDPSFTATWSFRKRERYIEIKATWFAIPYLPDENVKLSELQRAPNLVVVNQKEFVAMWIDLLRLIKTDLETVGYNSELEGYKELEDLLK